jgi:hypothetical protein
MRTVLLLIYVVVLALGAVGVYLRSRRTFEYEATRFLPRNHCLVAGDLRAPDLRWVLAPRLPEKSAFVGKYLDRELSPGMTVKREYLAARPVLRFSAGTESYAWLLREGERRWAEVLEPGWTVDLCAKECPLLGARVLAVECVDGASCAVQFEVTAEQKSALAGYRAKQELKVVLSGVYLGGTL